MEIQDLEPPTNPMKISLSLKKKETAAIRSSPVMHKKTYRSADQTRQFLQSPPVNPDYEYNILEKQDMVTSEDVVPVIAIKQYEASAKVPPEVNDCWQVEDDTDKYEIKLKLRNLEMENEALKNQIKQANKEMLPMLEQFRAANEERSEVGKNLQNELVKLKAEYEKVLKANNQYENRIRFLESSHCNTNDEANVDAHASKMAYNKLLNDYEDLKTDFENHKEEMEQLLLAKDDEITALNEGTKPTEITKDLFEKNNALKKERDKLKEQASNVLEICSDMKMKMEILEARCSSAEQFYLSISKSLKEERFQKKQVQDENNAFRQEIYSMKQNTDKLISHLQATVNEKNKVLDNYLDYPSHDEDCNNVQFNVADYIYFDDASQCDLDYSLEKSKMINSKQMKMRNLLENKMQKDESIPKLTESGDGDETVEIKKEEPKKRCNVFLSLKTYFYFNALWMIFFFLYYLATTVDMSN